MEKSHFIKYLFLTAFLLPHTAAALPYSDCEFTGPERWANEYKDLHGGEISISGITRTYRLKYGNYYASWYDFRGPCDPSVTAPESNEQRSKHKESDYGLILSMYGSWYGPNNARKNFRGICIGGDRCGQNNAIAIPVPPNGTGYVSSVHVRAHDREGRKHRAHLQLWEGNTLIDERDVKKDRSDPGFHIEFKLNRPITDTLYLRSVHESWRRGGKYLRAGDETVIEYLQVYDK